MNSQITRATDGTITLKITAPWTDVEKEREKVIDEMVKHVELPGFRKGTAPRKIAAEKLSKERVNEETLKKVLPDAYVKAVGEQKVAPIVHPRIHVEAFEEGTDLIFSAETCEQPQIDLKNYKDEVKKVTAKSKIIIPGQKEEEKKVSLDEIMSVIAATTDIKIPKILVDQEANRLLSQMLDELKTLGLSLEQYLASRGKTGDQLRTEYEEKATRDLKIEFILRKIADDEKITVEEKDIQAALAEIKDEKQKAELSKNPYLVASIIRQQKTLDFLSKI